MIVPRERFYVEVAPGFVRLRHHLGLHPKFGRGQLGPLMEQVVRQLEDLEEAGESIEFNRLDPDEEVEILAAEEQARRENEELFLDTLDPDEVADYFEAKELEAARKAAQERLGRGAKGMSERSRREMWRWVLSLPFEMLGDRPLWITLTYPGDWRTWVPDGPTLERHRRAFFYANNDHVAKSMRRSVIAAYMAGEAAKAGQKVPPDDFGTVGRYFGTSATALGSSPPSTCSKSTQT